MGWFSGEDVKVLGLTFTSLSDQSYDKYMRFRRGLIFASAGNAEVYGMELYKYRKNYKRSYDHRRIRRAGLNGEPVSIEKRDYTPILTYLQDNYDPEVSSIDTLIERTRINSSYTEDIPTSAEQFDIFELFTDQVGGKPYFVHDDDNDIDVYSNMDTVGEDENNVTWEITTPHSMSADNRTMSFVYTERTYKKVCEDTDDGSGNGTTFQTCHIEQDTTTTNIDGNYDVQDYFWSKVVALSTNNGNVVKATYQVHTQYYRNAYTLLPPVVLTHAPLMSIKEQNHTLEIDNEDATEEEKRLARKQRKLLKSFGLTFDTLESLINNGQIDDLKVGLAISPDDALRSMAVTKYLYNYFELIGGDANIPTVVSATRNRYFSFQLGNMTASCSFNLSEVTINGTMPNGNQAREWRIKFRQTITNEEKYDLKMKKVYIDCFPGGDTDGKTVKVMLDEVKAEYNSYNGNPDDRPDNVTKAFDELPPNDCFKRIKPSKYQNVFCSESEIDAQIAEYLTYELDPNSSTKTIIYEKVMHKIKHGISDGDKYFVRERTVYSQEPYEDGVEAGFNPVLAIDFFKQINENQYKQFTYCAGRITYVIDGETVTKEHTTRDGSFRLFMLEEAMSGLPFNEFCDLYDKGMCGIAFSIEITHLKWYQTATFAIVFQIVMIVIAVAITIASAGSGTSISAAILDVATNMVVAYAITEITAFVAAKIGGDIGKIAAVASAIAVLVLAGKLDTNNLGQLFLTMADQYIKADLQSLKDDMKRMQSEYKEFAEELNKKMKKITDYMGKHENSRTREEIYANIQVRDWMNASTGSRIISMEEIEQLEDEEWKLPEVKSIEYDQAEILYNKISIPEDNYEFEHKMLPNFSFGDDKMIKD